MRRGHIALLVLLPLTTTASGQTPIPRQHTMPPLVDVTAIAPVTAPIVVARILSFDRDKDGRVVKEELPERMQNLLVNDVNGDGALDSAEIEVRAVATTAHVHIMPAGGVPMPAGATLPRPPHGGGYMFGDQVGLSTRSHIEGALDDLRLGGLTREQALAVVQTFMNVLLSPAQMESVTSSLNRQMTNRNAVRARVSSGFETVRRVFHSEPDLAMRINQFGLKPDEHRQALAAVERFKATIRPGDAERTALLGQLADILSDEERDNFGAALARRPLVKAGDVMAGGFMINRGALPGGAPGGVVSGVVGGGAVLVKPTFPPKPVLKP
jgi:hypothetical protein